MRRSSLRRLRRGFCIRCAGWALAAAVGLLPAGCSLSGCAVVAEVPGDAWDETVELRLPNDDTLGCCDWQLFLRCDDRFAADTFALRITVLTPDSLRFEETLPVRLAAERTPAPVLPVVRIDYRRRVRLARRGLYRLHIRPLRPIEGVGAVGLQTLNCD